MLLVMFLAFNAYMGMGYVMGALIPDPVILSVLTPIVVVP